MQVWAQRCTELAWYALHLDDVHSDMSVYHRVDDIHTLTADVFVPRMERLKSYGGAVASSLEQDVLELARDTAEPEPESVSVADYATPGTHEVLQNNPLFGPLNGQVALFEASVVPT